MEMPSLTISIAALFGIIGIAFVATGLILHFSNKIDPGKKHFEERKTKLEQQMRDVRKKKDELEEERKQLRQAGKEVSDLDWRINDIDWRIDDLEWEMGDTIWENNDRLYQRRTSKATFWTILGAASLALASLVFSIVPALAK